MKYPTERLNRYLQNHNEGERQKAPPIPEDVQSLLNEAQLTAYETLQSIGWTLSFVRRIDVDPPVCVFKNEKTGDYASIEDNGDVTINPDIDIRD